MDVCDRPPNSPGVSQKYVIDVLMAQVAALTERITRLEEQLAKKDYIKPSFLDFHFIKEGKNSEDRTDEELRREMLRSSIIRNERAQFLGEPKRNPDMYDNGILLF